MSETAKRLLHTLIGAALFALAALLLDPVSSARRFHCSLAHFC